MTFRIIHSRFTIDLPIDFTTNLVNNIFQDSLTYNYTFPFSVTLTEQENAALGYLTDLYSQNINSIYEDVRFESFNRVQKAVLHIDSIKGRTVELRVVYGLEGFPNENIMLSDLPLYKQEVEEPETIYTIAESLRDKTYPETVYNFSAFHLEEGIINTDTDEWEFFKGTVNLYRNNNYVQNEYDAEDDLQLNYNIMQPTPYIMHVLHKGLEGTGFELSGDILNDEVLEKTTLITLSEYYHQITDVENEEIYIKADEYDSVIAVVDLYCEYTKEIEFTSLGRYKISGNLMLNKSGWYSGNVNANFKFNNETIVEYNVNDKDYKYFNIDFIVDVTPGILGEKLYFEAFQNASKWGDDGELVYDFTLLDITVSKLTSYDIDGNPVSTLQIPKHIDLSECVPTVTYGEFFDAVRKARGYAPPIPLGDKLIVNKLKLGDKGRAHDLSKYENEPERITNKTLGYLYTHGEIFNEHDKDYYPNVLVTSRSMDYNPRYVPEEVIDFFIRLVTMKLKDKNNTNAPFLFTDDNTQIVVSSYPLSQQVLNEYKLQNIIGLYEEFNRVALNSLAYSEELQILANDLVFDENSTIYMYSSYLLVDTLQITRVNENVFHVNLETRKL
ncbi:MAG TPA: hypothetical protein VK050_06515 [Flavobacteriaceae bacterium]|nr:hypothetical protein [Flavobacteriaceae bacterium]